MHKGGFSTFWRQFRTYLKISDWFNTKRRQFFNLSCQSDFILKHSWDLNSTPEVCFASDSYSANVKPFQESDFSSTVFLEDIVSVLVGCGSVGAIFKDNGIVVSLSYFCPLTSLKF